MKKYAIIFAVFILLVAGACRSGLAAGFDHSKFDRILKTYVNQQRVMN